MENDAKDCAELKGICGMSDSASISQLISQLGSIQPVPGVGGGDSGFRALDEGEVAAATLVTFGATAISDLIKGTKSDSWVVRYRCAYRYGLTPVSRFYIRGFRCVVSADSSSRSGMARVRFIKVDRSVLEESFRI